MAHYIHDMTHCNQSQCKLKDRCYRYWLGQEIKNTDYQLAWFYAPSYEDFITKECGMFLDIKDY